MSEARGKLESVDVRPLSPPSKPSSKPLIPGGPCENPVSLGFAAMMAYVVQVLLMFNFCEIFWLRGQWSSVPFRCT